MFDEFISHPHLLFPRDGSCVDCPANPDPCDCSAGQICQTTIRSCTACAQNVCVADPSASKSGGGISNGAVAGAVIGCILLLTLTVTGFFVWRRRVRAKKAALLALEKTTISPFDLAGPPVLNSPLGVLPPGSPVHSPGPPSPHPSRPGSGQADVRIYNNAVINLDSAAGPSRGGDNPFSDSASMTTMGTNVIPIAYLPPNSTSMSISDGMAPMPSPTAPSRPARSPDLDLRLPPNAVSRASMLDHNGGDLLAPRSPYGAQSTKSGVSAVSSRASVMSGVSSVYERPTIVTSAKVGRQVLGVVRAEVVAVPNSPLRTPTSAGGATGLRARTSVRSPLAGPAFSPVEEVPPVPDINPGSPMSTKSNPFADAKSPQVQEGFLRTPVSPTHMPLPPSAPPSPAPSAGDLPEGRLLTPTRSDSFPPMPPIPPEADAPRFPRHVPRESTSSFVSATSRADSILNGGFVFYPPTPGSTHQASFAPQEVGVPGRRTLGFSTYSTSSNVSSGLEAFPFHFGNAGPGITSNQPESARNTGPPLPAGMSLSTLAGAGYVPQDPPTTGVRASLDTLALSRDVEAYPLGYDRQPPMHGKGV